MHAANGFPNSTRLSALRGWGLAALLGLAAGCSESPVTFEAPVPPQASVILDNLLAAGVETLPGPIPTYYSPGYGERAAALQAWLRDADVFFRNRLRVNPEFSLAVLAPEHWALVSRGPYGVPFVPPLSPGDLSVVPRLVVLPAVPEQAVVTQIYSAAQGSLPPNAAAQLAALGISYEEAVLQVLDLIGFHEVGHVYIAALGYHRDNTARWLEELLATYAAYSYLDVAQPSAITVWDALSEALLGFVPPVSRSLDDFNALYIQGLGPATYGWFQSHFNLRSTVVLKHRPRATWFAQLNGLGLDEDTRAMPTSELLSRLRGFNPSFTEWADAAGLQYE
ncbi:hypothetical protein BH23GEM9_BH23GEM9_19880 [soil metagenome]